jgi:hypothetical protein
MLKQEPASSRTRFLLIALIFSLSACSGFSQTGEADPQQDRDSRGGSLINNDGSRGFNLSRILNPTGDSGAKGLPVNALLWRASLDTVSVMPLASVDSFGGSIITDWYAHPDDASKRIKLSVFVIDQELRADSIKVYVYVQERPEGLFDWSDLGRDDALAVRLEDLILTRAREIRASSIAESN